MSVLVTGAAGVIGGFVVRGLLERGEDVVAMTRDGAPGSLAGIEDEIEIAVADLRDGDALAALCARPAVDTVIHLAAFLPARSQADPVSATAVNVLGTAALFEAATAGGARRFVYASSKSAYGPMPAGEAVVEARPAHPRDVYGATKYAGEVVIGAAAARPGAPRATSLRFATIYGPGKADRHAGAALTSRLIADALAGRPVRIERGGDQVDDLIYVADAAAGIVAAALSPTELGPLYNLSTGVGISLRDFAAAVAAAIPGAAIEVGPGLEYMGPDFVYGVMDPTLARADLGFAAEPDPTVNTRRFAADSVG
ncbi:MAG: NAD-dependent epimerase/dehydratase family protein [Solirubrobacterales bacterium]